MHSILNKTKRNKTNKLKQKKMYFSIVTFYDVRSTCAF